MNERMNRKRYTTLDCDTIIQEKRKSVFVSFYSTHEKKITKSVSKNFPLVLLIMRADGRMGFPGGKHELKDNEDSDVTTMEDLKNTAIREVYEELGYEIKYKENLKLETNFLLNGNQILNFSYYVKEEELVKIINNYKNKNTKDHLELSGVNICYIQSMKVLKEIIKNNFKTTARDELLVLLKRHFNINNPF